MQIVVGWISLLVEGEKGGLSSDIHYGRYEFSAVDSVTGRANDFRHIGPHTIPPLTTEPAAIAGTFHRDSAGLRFIVDSIGDTVTVDEDQIENRRERDKGAPEGGERRSLDLGGGICKLEEGLFVIVRSRNLLKIIGNLKANREGGSVTLD